MKLLIVADTTIKELLEPAAVGLIRKDIDLIISCGDLPPEYLSALRNRYEVPLFYVLGNHDIRYTSSPPRGCTLIDRRFIRFHQLKIVGFSGSRWYNGNINQYTEEQMTTFINRMRFTLWRHRGTDMVVTHAPPRYIHDAEDLCHRGFRSFRTFIDKYRPDYFLHGHIHARFDSIEARTTKINNTSVINCYGYHLLEI